MNERDLQQLLRDADRQAGPPSAVPQVSVHSTRDRLLRRRSRQRVFVGAMTVMLLLAAGALWRTAGLGDRIIEPPAPIVEAMPAEEAPVEKVPATTSPNVAQPDLASLTAEAEFHALVARRMIAALEQQKAIEALQRERALGDPLEQVRQELDTAAFHMIARADRILEQMGPRDSAIAIYRDVIRMFPATHSAGLAQERLAKIDQPQGDS